MNLIYNVLCTVMSIPGAHFLKQHRVTKIVYIVDTHHLEIGYLDLPDIAML